MLTKEQRTEYGSKAELWNKEGISADTCHWYGLVIVHHILYLTNINSLAKKEAYSSIKDFSMQMEKRLGVQLVILSAHVDPKGCVTFCK
jgi:hypothetical protein